MAAYIQEQIGQAVKKDPSGEVGEFEVWVGGKKVEEKGGGIIFPNRKKILAAVKAELDQK